jgi:hypothetical protein
LTTGLTGSSVVAGLLKHAGYWTGANTAKKADYDTFENSELVAANERLLIEAGSNVPFNTLFRRQEIEAIIARLRDVDLACYRRFVDECDRHRPWVWKDPRLRLTIRFWVPLLDRDSIRIVIITRQHSQAWISRVLRKYVETPRFWREYANEVRGSLLEFVNEHNLPHIELEYEKLLLRPEETLECLNDFLGTRISTHDLLRVYHGPLYRSRHGFVDHIIACLIFLKNSVGSRIRSR